jgi:predicted metal-dependent hydrolase
VEQQSHTPIDVPITPRNREHNVSQCLARDWYDKHAFKTAWYNAMSITFPLGEKFFIDSVRFFSDQVTDPKLKEEVSRFCGQEGFHRREHDRYNHALCEARGYDLDYLEGRIAKNIAMSKKIYSPIEQLAITAALEHLTAILAESALSPGSPESDGMEAPMRELWNWHAAEEMEHKSVAFDVYVAVGGNDRMRRRVMRSTTFFLFFDFAIGAAHMLKRDGKLWSPQLWVEGFKFLFGKNGIYRRIWPAYKQWYKDGFHPWQRDTRELLEDWQASQDTVAA